MSKSTLKRLAFLFDVTTGMVIADAIGIIFGIVLCKNIPERLIKWFAALIFILFGLLGLYGSLPKYLLTLPVVIGGTTVVALLIWLMARTGKTSRVENKDSHKTDRGGICKTPSGQERGREDR